MADPERDIDAAERALGTLPQGPEGPEERAAREGWEMRLAPLLDVFRDVPPPAALFGRIERRIEHERVVVDLAAARRRTRRWQGIAALAGAAAAALAIWVAIPAFSPPPRYVAVVVADQGGAPGMVIEFDTGTGIATVVPLVTNAPEGRALELWHLPAGAERPYSLGLMPANPEELRTIKAGPGDIFAISYEQPGGSPTGQPTDPRYHGRIVRVE